MSFFQKTVLKKYQAMLPKELLLEAWQKFQAYFLNPTIQENILHSKEEQFQEGFLRELFVKILGYTLNPSPDYNLITEQKNETDSKKADGAIWLNGKVIGIIELKDHKTTDLKKVEPQAFQYKSQNKEARYVIISNFEKLRLYIDNATEHREWNLFNISEADFEELYCCLAWSQIEKGIAIKMKETSVSVEKDVTEALYRDYSVFKRELFEDILKNNSIETQEGQLLLYKKTQKLLDRLLFIFFAEDGGLLPPNSMVQILDQWQQLKDLDEDIPLYNRIKKYFGYLDTGNSKMNIFAYNGGLFRTDEMFDSLVISDDLLYKHTKKLSEYDFKSDVDVNILGHIFEHSLSEIEEVTQRIMGIELDASKSKRKKDGVFYTPPYITKYIVENTVGKLCSEKKQELGIVEDEYFSDRKRQKQTKLRLLDLLKQYREWLLQITILDPACGSGAFLNAALSFLMNEHHLIDEMEAKVAGSAMIFQDVENSILENNLYGVDINEESVEIAQLALWLRTARPQRKLSSLNENIKCGNSLISDPNIAGDKAFDWEKEFPQVFAKGGFDVVIGNPPYVFAREKINLADKEYYEAKYVSAKYQVNTYILFMELSIRLCMKAGFVGLIIPNSWLMTYSGEAIRHFFIDNVTIDKIVNLYGKSFEEANVETVISIIRNRINKDNHTIDIIKTDDKNNSFEYMHNKYQNEFVKNKKCEFSIFQNEDSEYIINKIKENSRGLDEVASVKAGLQAYEKGKGVPKQTTDDVKSRPYDFTYQYNKETYKYLDGSNVLRYGINWTRSWLWYGKHLAAPRTLDLFTNEKIIIREITNDFPHCLNAVYTKDTYLYNRSNIAIVKREGENISLLYILVLLNSTLMSYYFKKNTAKAERKLFPKIILNDLRVFPIRDIQLEKQEAFIILGNQMLLMNEQLQEKRNRFLRRLSDNFKDFKITGALSTFDLLKFTDFLKELKKQKISLKLLEQDEWEDYFNNYRSVCNQLSEQIAKTEKEIDLRVYKLYGLTYDEVLIVDAGFSFSREEYNNRG